MIGLRFNKTATYRIKAQDHQIFNVSKSALEKVAGKRKGILVKRAAFPSGIRAYPETSKPTEGEWNDHINHVIELHPSRKIMGFFESLKKKRGGKQTKEALEALNRLEKSLSTEHFSKPIYDNALRSNLLFRTWAEKYGGNDLEPMTLEKQTALLQERFPHKDFIARLQERVRAPFMKFSLRNREITGTVKSLSRRRSRPGGSRDKRPPPSRGPSDGQPPLKKR